MDTTGLDALYKGLGFQPQKVAAESRLLEEKRQDVSLTRTTESEIADLWAQGLVERNPDKVARARKQLMDWNRSSPETPIRIAPGQISRRVKEMQKTRAQRFIKSAPAELRGGIAADLSQ